MGISDWFSSSSSSSSAPTPTSPPSPPPPPPPAAAASPSATAAAGQAKVDTSSKFVTPLNPQGIKPCCACPETKIARDDCFLQYGHEGLDEGEKGEAWRCRELVERHRQCMKQLGFKI